MAINWILYYGTAIVAGLCIGYLWRVKKHYAAVVALATLCGLIAGQLIERY